MAIWGRDKIYSGTDGNGSFNTDANLPENNDSGGFLKNLLLSPISTTVTGLLTRNKWLRTIFYKQLESQLHKLEDRAKALNLNVALESDQTIYVTPEQLPALTAIANDFTINTVPTDGTLTSNIVPLSITPLLTGKGVIYQVNFSQSFLKLFIERTKTEALQNYYVDGQNGDDVLGDGSILKPYKTPTWAAHKARSYSFTSNNPVTITVYGGAYTVLDTQTVTIDTVNINVVGNLWIYGGWDFKPGVEITFDSVSGSYLFNSTTIPANQMIGNMVVKGELKLVSANGGCIEHKTVSSTNYEIDFEWLRSQTFKEFVYIDKISGSDFIPVRLKNGQAFTTASNLSCIKALNRPVIFAKDCLFSNNNGSTVPEIDFNPSGADTLGIYCTFNSCQIGNAGVGGQVRVGRNSSILDFINCEWFGPSSATKDCIVLESATLAQIGSFPIRLVKNFVTRRVVLGTGTNVINFINAFQNATIVAVDNDCNAARLTAQSGATLITTSLNPTSYSAARTVVGGTSYPSTFAINSDGVFTPAYNFWV